MNRREFLTALGAAAGTSVSGCIGLNQNEPLALGEFAEGAVPPSGGSPWEAAVTAIKAQSSAFGNDTVAAADSHFVFIAIGARLPSTGSYSIPNDIPGTFTAQIDDRTYEPLNRPLVPDESQGAFGGYAYEVTEPSGDTVDVVWDTNTTGGITHRWSAPLSSVDGLQQNARGGNISVTTPDTAVVDGDEIVIQITAENVGDTEGRIRAGWFLDSEQGLRQLTMPEGESVAVGDTYTWEVNRTARGGVAGVFDREPTAVTAEDMTSVDYRVFSSEPMPRNQ